MPKPSARKTIFISHISDEGEIAQWLKTRLDADFLGGLDIFVSSDRSTIAAGRRWLDEVHKALKSADLQIILCSRASVGRPWVNFEAGAVWLRDIPVIPVCHSGLKPEALPVPLSMLEGISLSDGDGLAKLYDSVAAAMGLRTPAVNFDAIAADARVLEAKHEGTRGDIDVIPSPRILCAASAEYAQPEFRFDLDEGIVERYFPGKVLVERALTPARLRDLLTTNRFDIVHLVLPVWERTGHLIFDPVNHQAVDIERAATMSPSAFAGLLQESQTRLVVLATCKALLLGVTVSRYANMAASDQDITGDEAAAWEECFYRLLAQGKSVFKAFDITQQQMATPIRPIHRKDVIFGGGTV
jgi:hypothetical protein